MADYYLYFIGAALILGFLGFLLGSGKISFGPLPFLAALIVIVLPLAFNSFVWIYASSPGEAVVPNVLGLPSSGAFAAIKAAGLTPEISGISFSQKSSGIVLSQRPEAGRKVRPKRIVELVLSAMERGITVPALIGKSREEAENMLGEKGFIIEETFIVSEEAQADTVIAQSPDPGQPLASGSSVSITIVTKGENND